MTLLPTRYQPPAHPGAEAFGLLGVLADGLNVLSRGNVVARNPIVLGLDTEAFGEFGGTAEAEASTLREEY